MIGVPISSLPISSQGGVAPVEIIRVSTTLCMVVSFTLELCY
jgi:hypothetical protein